MERSEEARNLLNSVQDRLLSFIQHADQLGSNSEGKPDVLDAGDLKFPSSSLLECKKPEELRNELQLGFPTLGQGQDGLLEILDKILRYSVNTWHQGFLDKLYASTNAPGLAAELILAALNTNVHVYQVSPVLSIIEKTTSQRLASLFGLDGPHAGGISVQGGSASNTTAMVIARNTLFPSTKTDGIGGYSFVLFTSAHGHYSIEKAAQMMGLGSSAVWDVPVDGKGRMVPSSLDELIGKAKKAGKTPFFVNATAGTTVLGAFDPMPEIAEICRKHGIWFHIDGSWGGSFVFSSNQKSKLVGSHLADSIAINPHKMLGVPVTCSFLLGPDLRKFHRANTLPAGYLFHREEPEPSEQPQGSESNSEPECPEIWDLADLTLQCGRRADSLKLFLSWNYYGSKGYENQIDSACDVAAHLAHIISRSPDLVLLSENPPPCLQVCFYYAPFKRLVYHPDRVINGQRLDETKRGKFNSQITENVAKELISEGYMVDFAPPSGDGQSLGDGKFFRCVVNVLTQKETVERLVTAILKLAPKAVGRQRGVAVDTTIPNPDPTAGPGLRPKKNPMENGHGPVVHY